MAQPVSNEIGSKAKKAKDWYSQASTEYGHPQMHLAGSAWDNAADMIAEGVLPRDCADPCDTEEFWIAVADSAECLVNDGAYPGPLPF